MKILSIITMLHISRVPDGVALIYGIRYAHRLMASPAQDKKKPASGRAVGRACLEANGENKISI
jgi:hypothetical protein